MISCIQYYLYVLVIVITLKLLLALVRSIDHTSFYRDFWIKTNWAQKKEGLHSSDKHTKVIRAQLKLKEFLPQKT